jgi:hypothetical protein
LVPILLIVVAVLLLVLVLFLMYRAVRSYDAGQHATFLTMKGGEFHGALRQPTILWNPSIQVLRGKNAPDISVITSDASGSEYFEKSLVVRRTGEVSLRIHTCAPRPFIVRTRDKRTLKVKARVSFQLDVDRIHIPGQMEAFGANLGVRVENLFDNAIGALNDEQVYASQTDIETSVLRQMQDIEFPADPTRADGMPLGIKVYEAIFSYEPLDDASSLDDGQGLRGAMEYPRGALDDIASMLKEADPRSTEVLLRMMEMQMKQNIVQMLCQSGGLVAFTAQELGLTEHPQVRERFGLMPMTPPPAPPPAQPDPAAAGPAVPRGPLTAAEKAAAYYGTAPAMQAAAPPPKEEAKH